MKLILALFGLIGTLVAGMGNANAIGSIAIQPWGTVDGRSVMLYTLSNSHGLVCKITNYGGIVTSLKTPDRTGHRADIVLGYDNLAQYVKNVNNPYFGALIGRYANRIGRPRRLLSMESRTMFPPTTVATVSTVASTDLTELCGQHRRCSRYAAPRSF